MSTSVNPSLSPASLVPPPTSHSHPPPPPPPSLPPRHPCPTYPSICSLYYSYVYRLCCRQLRNPTLAEDLTQDIFLHLYHKLHLYRGESSFTTWLYTVTMNQIRMRARKNKGIYLESMEALLETGGSGGSGGGGNGKGASEGNDDGRRPGQYNDIVRIKDHVLEFTPNRVALMEAIQSLPAGYRTILLLHDYEGWQHNEIAQQLGITEGTSKSQLFKARRMVREMLKGVEGGTKRR